MQLRKIKRALLSVSDKSNLIPLAQGLHDLGVELISTGGTGRALQEAQIPYTDIQAVTGNPEAFGGRMKTISFQIGSALLFDRERDAQEAQNLNIEGIDLVVCNLYPFQKVQEAGADFPSLIENIDIGGPTMIRAAAKNFKDVAVLVQASDYEGFLAELQSQNGQTSLALRQQLMAKAFNHTADYDARIAMRMDEELGKKSLRLSFKQGRSLRYGENSHQAADFYRENSSTLSLADIRILHGKALSYNNLLDVQGAVDAVQGLGGQAVAVVKHSNPCGLAKSMDQRAALEAAWSGDPISAFGSIIAFNQPLELKTAEFFQLDAEDRSQRKFVEVVIAPKITAEALEYLQQHKNLRVLELDIAGLEKAVDYRYLSGSLLVQEADLALYKQQESVTARPFPSDEAAKGLVEFSLQAIKSIKSNAIVLVQAVNQQQYRILGMGAGQPNRLVATKLAIEKAKENLKREGAEDIASVLGQCYLVSDAFFPFADNVELATQAGIRHILQPGGSIRDKSVIAACDQADIAMLFTGLRHFKH
ncbi:bifunctional phosphoribosylaminoimidazolecarboxamide formyltransferase/IMP cyclohydrolase [Saprospira grandis]|uniref:bifunctional phosphoribosylaminoimidazolecarboxamide formyltransferase/IMP cyclohydrolase n=1 Tax=Saprospira grandis TaxID=1008 RepID=UPI0022DDEA41|nr:bifunctional phosphoribosylaminoimidazolecarboxamide formyltransferase/IMP cyclohydrolase [Saprospira grandis]WBM76313.1 bifunctional phosphoribosylaminoimidazolecarboxamide formyltransferase/IMP cyclohydrolase [Saprospira grandis]